MEERIKSALDHLTLTQAKNLLADDFDKMDMKLNGSDIQRMKKAVRKKAGLENKPGIYIPKKLSACLATVIIILTCFSLVGFDNVVGAVEKLFSFIPGYGIVKNNEDIKFVLAQPVTEENDKAVFSVINALANKESLTIMYTLQHRDEPVLLKPHIALYAGDHKITDSYGSTTHGEKGIDYSSYTFDLKTDEIGSDITYKLEYIAYNLLLEFQLQDYTAFTELEEIGATGYNNDISITAVPTFMGEKLQVDLYAINNSDYLLEEFSDSSSGFESPYLNRSLHLDTNSGTKEFTTPNFRFGFNGRFFFDIQPDDREFILSIPYLFIRSNEEKYVSMKVPKEGEITTLNQMIEFKDCIMTIVDIERFRWTPTDDNEDLKMTIKYENKSLNKIMIRPEFERRNFFGIPRGGGYSYYANDNSPQTTIYYQLNKGERTLRLKIHRPLYYLTDEYTLHFSR